FADEIESTPIPAIIDDEEQIKQIKANLKKIASPFVAESENYRKTKEEQLKQVPMEQQKKILGLLGGAPVEFSSALKVERKAKPSVEALNLMEIQNQLQILQDDPNNKNAIQTIHNYYVKNKRLRLAAYFKGRLKK
ncbi:MAG: hypothetical protein OXB84_04890, partial [Halobacteriovoraceae bacterium]|nr:hypothetical protein [Halobacteriovoraceae bacterium]